MHVTAVVLLISMRWHVTFGFDGREQELTFKMWRALMFRCSSQRTQTALESAIRGLSLETVHYELTYVCFQFMGGGKVFSPSSYIRVGSTWRPETTFALSLNPVQTARSWLPVSCIIRRSTTNPQEMEQTIRS